MPFLVFRRDHWRLHRGSIYGSGSFALQFDRVEFGDHFRSGDNLRSGIICSAVQHFIFRTFINLLFIFYFLHATLMSSKLEPAMWSRDTGQEIPCFDRGQLTITFMSNIKYGATNRGCMYL